MKLGSHHLAWTTPAQVMKEFFMTSKKLLKVVKQDNKGSHEDHQIIAMYNTNNISITNPRMIQNLKPLNLEIISEYDDLDRYIFFLIYADHTH